MEAAGPSSTSMAVVNQGIISDPEEEYSLMDLPPGYRFHPTDEEIISHYLTPKVINSRFVAVAIAEVDLNKCEPWDLPKRAKMGEKEMYFFCNRDRKYPTGMRTNRATECGYWKATGKDKEIYKQPVPGSGSRPGRRCLIGMRKTLVFYKGRAPKGEKTNWVMHEYRLEGEFSYYNFPNKDEWAVSRVFHKSSGMKRSPIIFPTGMNPYGNNDHHQLLEYCSNISLLPPLVENPTRPSLIDEDECTDGDGDYLSYLSVNLEDHPSQNRNINHSTPQTYNQIGPIKPDYSSNFYPQTQLPINHEYLQQEILPDTNQAILRALKGAGMSSEFIGKQCKMEQLSSNQSMISVSQDTGLSTDITAETSSRPSNRVYNLADIEDPNSAGPNVSDGLDYFWDY